MTDGSVPVGKPLPAHMRWAGMWHPIGTVTRQDDDTWRWDTRDGTWGTANTLHEASYDMGRYVLPLFTTSPWEQLRRLLATRF